MAMLAYSNELSNPIKSMSESKKLYRSFLSKEISIITLYVNREWTSNVYLWRHTHTLTAGGKNGVS